MPPVIDPALCKKCGRCADICNSHIFYFNRDTREVPVVRYPEECWHCDCCVLECPAKAITLRIPLPFTMLHVPSNTLKPRS